MSRTLIENNDYIYLDQFQTRYVRSVAQIPMDGENWPAALVNAAGIEAGQIKWLLAHTMQGVVWGRQEAGVWNLSHQINPDRYPGLSPSTTLDCRLFGAQHEILIWRSNRILHGRTISDPDSKQMDFYKDEKQILWGTTPDQDDRFPNFTLLTDGKQGLGHAFPLPIDPQAFTTFLRPARLHIRHYITRQRETGLARITHSRLSGLSVHRTSTQPEENG